VIGRLRLALVTLALVSALGSSGAGAGPLQEPTATLQLVDQTPWVEEGGTYQVRVRADDPPAGATVRATVHPASTSRIDFARAQQGQDLEDPIVDTGPVPAEAQLIRLPFAEADLDGTGVYPIQVTLAAGSGEALDQFVTHVVRLPGAGSDAAAMAFALVLPIDGGPGIRPDGRNGLRPAGLDDVRAVTSALLDHPDVPLTVLPTPDTAEALAGTDDLDDLRRALRERQVLTSPYVPIDLSAWVAAGMDDEIAFETTTGDTTLEEYLGVRPDRGSAVTDSTITPAALSRLRALGADQVVIPDAALAPLDPAEFPVTLAAPFAVETSAGDRQRAAVADAGLVGHLEETDDPVLDAHTLLADLAVIALDRPAEARGVVLAAPVGWGPRAAFLDTLLGALEQPGLVRSVTLDRWFAEVPDASVDGVPLVRALEPDPPVDLGRYPQDRAISRLSIEGYSSLVGEDNPRVPSLERRLLVSGSSAFGRTQRQAYIDAISVEIEGARDAIRVPEEQTVTLTSRDGRIPLNISNENLYDVEVLVRLESDDLEFSDAEGEDTGRIELPLELPRSTVTQLEVDVTARSSGSFPLEISLTSPDRVLDVGQTDVTVRSTAVSGVGLVISIGAVLFLAVWWASHFRSVRRARKLVPAEDLPIDPEAEE
jgi:hypothetical protein